MTEVTKRSREDANFSSADWKMDETFRTIAKAVADMSEELFEINQKIHQHPELGYEEVQAHDNIASFLENLGYHVERHAYGVETAFMAEFGTGGRVVAFNAEYDALPDMGHACGHNLIAMMSIGSFLGLAWAIKTHGIEGRVRLIGTPAEEGGGGKLKLIEAGAFKDVDACLMTHPGPQIPGSQLTGDAYMPTLANKKFNIHYTGISAHAALNPWQGVNALDAVVLAHHGISALRQQVRPDDRIHGVILQGGTRPNVITAHASLSYYIRSPTLQSAEALWARAKRCFDGAALQTGCRVDYEVINTYADVRPNRAISRVYADAMAALGSPVKCDVHSKPLPGSTDQGNVSYECPSIHAYTGIPAKPGAYNHTPGFTAHAGTREAHELCLQPAKGMAIAGWRVLVDKDAAAQVRNDFAEDKRGLQSPLDDVAKGLACDC